VHELRHESQLNAGARGEVTATLENRDQRGVSVAAERAVNYGGSSLYDNEDAERQREARSVAARLEREADDRWRESCYQMDVVREMESAGGPSEPRRGGGDGAIGDPGNAVSRL
jgi:hypothetical protein